MKNRHPAFGWLTSPLICAGQIVLWAYSPLISTHCLSLLRPESSSSKEGEDGRRATSWQGLARGRSIAAPIRCAGTSLARTHRVSVIPCALSAPAEVVPAVCCRVRHNWSMFVAARRGLTGCQPGATLIQLLMHYVSCPFSHSRWMVDNLPPPPLPLLQTPRVAHGDTSVSDGDAPGNSTLSSFICHSARHSSRHSHYSSHLCHHLAPWSGRGTGDIVGFTTRPTIAKHPSPPDPTDRQISSHRREVYMRCMAPYSDPAYMSGYHSQQC